MRLKLFGLVCVIWLVSLSGTVFSAEAGQSAGTKTAVLVTGASSGIGRMIAEFLAAEGILVYAGARKEADLRELDAIENIHAISLDVTLQQEIDAAVKTIRERGHGLHGLVNNAGVLIAGPAIETDLEQMKWMFDVNVFGVHRITRAFAPLLIKSKGRIVHIGSIAGSIGIKYLSAYSMTKHAIEAYTDAMAEEMQALGVSVSIVSPGDYNSRVWANAIEKGLGEGLVSKGSPFHDDVTNWIEGVAAMQTKEPHEVAVAVHHALFADDPRRRYLVLPDEGEAAWVAGSVVKRIAEQNVGQNYAYTPDELAKMIRDEIERLGSGQAVAGS